MKETRNIYKKNGPWEGEHLNFKPKCLSRRESRGAGLDNLFQIMLLPRCPRTNDPIGADRHFVCAWRE